MEIQNKIPQEISFCEDVEYFVASGNYNVDHFGAINFGERFLESVLFFFGCEWKIRLFGLRFFQTIQIENSFSCNLVSGE